MSKKKKKKKFSLPPAAKFTVACILGGSNLSQGKEKLPEDKYNISFWDLVPLFFK